MIKELMAKKNNSWKYFLSGAGAIVLVAALVFLALSNSGDLNKNHSNLLVIYHWWTSPGEKAAINALIAVFANKYPGVIIAPTSVVSGQSGGGVATFQLVRELILSGESPDAFQSHAGYETKYYVDNNLLSSVDSVWKSEGLELVTPKIVQVVSQFNGKYYSIPVGISRTNVVWYNKKVLNEHGIDPSTLTTWNAFFAACEKLKKEGVQYPVSQGTTWTAAFAFDQFIASEGINASQDWLNGKFISSDDSRLVDSLNLFSKYLSCANPDSVNVTWDQATGKVIEGKSAFNIMGDWAEGEFAAAGKVYGTDYGTFMVPGTSNMYGLVIDTFSMSRYAKHPDNADSWLDTVASEAGQDAFNPLKGSISVRFDANESKYGLYQQAAMKDFKAAKYMFPAVSNGAPTDFQTAEQTAIAAFVQDRNVTAAADALSGAMSQLSQQYTIDWQLG